MTAEALVYRDHLVTVRDGICAKISGPVVNSELYGDFDLLTTIRIKELKKYIDSTLDSAS